MEFGTKTFAEKIFLAAVRSVRPQTLIEKFMKIECDQLFFGHKWYPLRENVHLVGFGKAVLGMAHSTEKILKHHLKSGILCVPENTKEVFKNNPDFCLKEDSHLQIFEGAAGNLPDENSVKGAEAIVEKIKSLSETDILIVLISGGGSALLPKPRQGLTLADKLTTTKLLALAGATINELNTVRKHLSEVKGGGLALLSYPMTTIALILSDVVNDPLDIIASGPTVPNLNKSDAAFNILKKYKLETKVAENVLKILKKDFKNPCIPVAAKGYTHVDNFIIGNNLTAVQEAKICAERLGFRTLLLSTVINSSVHTISDFYVSVAFELIKVLHSNEIEIFKSNMDNILKKCHYDFSSTLIEDLLDYIKLKGFSKGISIVAGGETTVEVKGSGIGGRNQELVLLVSKKLFQLKQEHSMYFRNFDVTFLSAGTDGIDGNSTAAGAIGCADIISSALDNFIDPSVYLSNNDSNTFFKKIGGTNLINTGHTGTNVMDIHILIIRDLSALG